MRRSEIDKIYLEFDVNTKLAQALQNGPLTPRTITSRKAFALEILALTSLAGYLRLRANDANDPES